MCKMLERRGYCIATIETGDNYLRIPEVFMIFIPDVKVTVGHVKSIISSRLSDEKIIIAHTMSITSEARNMLSVTKDIQTFTYDEMGFDICEVIPKHEKVNGPKHKDWKLFPILLQTDIACRYFDFKKGDVIKVTEDDDTISYRKVI